jgi:HEAT repeat protein
MSIRTTCFSRLRSGRQCMRMFPIIAFLLSGVAFGQTPESESARIAAGAIVSSDVVSTHDRASTLLNISLKDKNPDTRMHAVQALGLVSPSEPYLSQLEAMLDDKDVLVQLATITSLVDLKNQRTVPTLLKALDSNVPEVSFAAAKALWALEDPSGHEALVAVLSGDSKTSSGFITKQKRDALRMLHTPQTLFLFAVTMGANFTPVPGLGAGVSSLQGLLSDPSVSGRAATALLLSGDKDPEVVLALRDALTDSDWSVRAAAVHALALRNDYALVGDLIPLLDDKKEAVRDRAAAGFLRLEAVQSAGAKNAQKAALKK